MLTLGSLFSGIGGFELGLERTGGFKTEWQCEIDPFCLKVLGKHWPDVKRFTDIKRMGIDEEVPYVDCICGGFPCQDISCAGKGAGIHADRSGLWWEMLRIIRMVGPSYVFLENVELLLNRGFDEILGSFSESGYNVEWKIIRASDFGLPHRRSRLFVIAYSNSIDGKAGMGDILERKKAIFGRSPTKCDELRILSGHRTDRENNGLSRRLDKDRIRALGNAIVPQCAEFVGRCLLDSLEAESCL